jgi:hypothetical protein
MMIDNTNTETIAPEQARRRGDPITRCVNDLLSANAHVLGNLDVPALLRLREFPKEDAAIVLRHVFDAINAAVAGLEPDAKPHFVDCPRCYQPLEAPSPDVQIARLRDFQLTRAAYWQWSPRELLLLKESLKPGDVIVPMYAHSCGIRKPNGRTVEYRRTAIKEETHG